MSLKDYSFFRKQLSGLDIIECPGDPDAPTIICCHGYGGNANNMTFFPQLCSWHNIKPTWIFPNGIEKISSIPEGRAWFPLDILKLQNISVSANENIFNVFSNIFNADFNKPRSILENLISDLNLPKNKIIIGGFSQGAMMTTDIILNSRDKFLGALILSGAMLINKKWEDKTHHNQTPFLQSHGLYDHVLPYLFGKELYHFLHKNNLKGELISFEGEHDIPNIVLKKIQESIANWVQNTI